MNRTRKVTGLRTTTKARPRTQENLDTTDYVEAADTGHLLPKLKDDLVCFELRDLNRIETRLQKAQTTSKVKDYYGLSLFCAGAFVSLVILLISLYLSNVPLPLAIMFIVYLATALSFTLSIAFWSMSRKFVAIQSDYIGEVMEEITHHKAKFLR